MSNSQPPTTIPAYSTQERDAFGTKRRYHHKQSFCYIIRSGFAGGVAGCVAKTVIAPLDRVKILFQASNPHFQKYAGTWIGVFQASKEIYSNNGVRGLFQGHSATLIRILPYAAIKFVAFEQIRHIFMPNKETAFRHLLSGSLAGITSVLCTYPLELIRVRLAYEVRNDIRIGYVSLCKQIYHESAASHRQFIHLPIMNFYRGLNPTIIGMIPYAGISFWTHYSLTNFCRTTLADMTTKPSLAAGKLDSRGQSRKAPLKTWAELTVGGLSGAVAQTISYPLEVIRRRMQVYGALDPTKYIGVWQTIRTIWATNGLKGFFVGLSIGYLKVTPMVAVSFTVYGRMKLLLNID
ncbi:mitochondrial carrier domain-containing protein [Glomus cerebriforme]|uniref:Mitochondrial carrier domain-containing protein n=1 Tax=Glomus cerebriforme TaxID=658196 RepID=A0A397T6X4_9GLOM|nr:mitochondrial carrier domain-containing protein [Glomus cerebriforme]